MTIPSEKYPPGEGSQPEHRHGPLVHSHDHYHVSHHHDGSVLGEWTHRTYWHTHEHDHRSVVHCHHYGAAEEAEEHGKEAHVHDHAAPVH